MHEANKKMAEDALDIAAAMRGMRASLLEGGFAPESADQGALAFMGFTMQMLMVQSQQPERPPFAALAEGFLARMQEEGPE